MRGTMSAGELQNRKRPSAPRPLRILMLFVSQIHNRTFGYRHYPVTANNETPNSCCASVQRQTGRKPAALATRWISSGAYL